MSMDYPIEKIEIIRLRPYPRHAYKEYEGEKLEEMVESIKNYGVLSPILVRPVKDTSDKYEIIAGHNRVKAAKIAGIEQITATVRELTDDEADILMVESNIKTRTVISPTEKGKSYKAYLEAHKRQGTRSDLTDREMTSGRIGHKSTRAELSLICGDSETQIRRYIDIVKLIPELQDLVDSYALALSPAVNISVLTDTEQKSVYKEIKDKPSKLNISNSTVLRDEKLKRESEGVGKLEVAFIRTTLNEKTAPKRKIKSLKLDTDFITKHFGDGDLYEEDILDKLERALEMLKSVEPNVTANPEEHN